MAKTIRWTGSGRGGVVQEMVRHARLGRQVVRPKGRHPFVFGRGGVAVPA